MSDDTLNPIDDPTSGARGHQAAQAVIHSPNAPSTALHTPKRQPAPAGPYRLVVSVWRELVSKAGEPKRFVEHVYGEIVELTEEDAERLLRGGAVEPTTDEQASSYAAQQRTVFDKAAEVNAAVGPQPVPSNEGAAPSTGLT